MSEIINYIICCVKHESIKYIQTFQFVTSWIDFSHKLKDLCYTLNTKLKTEILFTEEANCITLFESGEANSEIYWTQSIMWDKITTTIYPEANKIKVTVDIAVPITQCIQITIASILTGILGVLLLLNIGFAIFNSSQYEYLLIPNAAINFILWTFIVIKWNNNKQCANTIFNRIEQAIESNYALK